ncbi:MAG TPA: hypothetical protein VMW09_03460 [Desulfatiglandales bacterium]|nr:hypothetical protein [Desulfatiglandales bacterium]
MKKINQTYWFACPKCRKIFPLYFVSYSGKPKESKISEKCPECGTRGEALEERFTGIPSIFNEALAINEALQGLELAKNNARELKDITKLIRLQLLHYYLDMRVLEWERGGSRPLDDQPSGGLSNADDFFLIFESTLKLIDGWHKDEPFMLEILDNRINQRMQRIAHKALTIPKDKRTAEAYKNLLSTLNNNKSENSNLVSITPKEMLQKPFLKDVLHSDDQLEIVFVNMIWIYIFLSETDHLFISEEKRFMEKHRKKTLLSTILEARNGKLNRLIELIAWDNMWFYCPWVKKTMESNWNNRNFHDELRLACYKKVPGCMAERQHPPETLKQVLDDSGFIYDRFFCNRVDFNKTAKLIFEFVDKAESFKDYEKSYKYDLDSFKKLLKRRPDHIRL